MWVRVKVAIFYICFCILHSVLLAITSVGNFALVMAQLYALAMHACSDFHGERAVLFLG